jgi:hypothetical protein
VPTVLRERFAQNTAYKAIGTGYQRGGTPFTDINGH